MNYEQGLPEKFFDRKIVANGKEALPIYKEWKPDIVLLDLLMPEMNGVEILKEIRETNNDKSTTVIMVSSVSEKEEVLACAKLGIQGYIVKPFITQNLTPTIVDYHKSAKQKMG